MMPFAGLLAKFCEFAILLPISTSRRQTTCSPAEKLMLISIWPATLLRLTGTVVAPMVTLLIETLAAARLITVMAEVRVVVSPAAMAVAVMIAVPGPLAVTMPAASTVATAVLLDV